MRGGRFWPTAVIVAAALLAACDAAPEPSPSASPATTPSATPAATGSPTQSPAPTASPSPTDPSSPTAECATFGTTGATASSPDWSSQLRTTPGDALWGETMRTGDHECYERWVFEFDGDGAMPGWAVNPHAGSTFDADGSGEPIAHPLAGAASLEVLFAAWYDGTPLGEEAYEGPMVLLGAEGSAIREVRIVSGFEGISQVGIGLDEERPYRVTWLEDPGRLVIDVFTG